jgi:hypothetical protein
MKLSCGDQFAEQKTATFNAAFQLERESLLLLLLGNCVIQILVISL